MTSKAKNSAFIDKIQAKRRNFCDVTCYNRLLRYKNSRKKGLSLLILRFIFRIMPLAWARALGRFAGWIVWHKNLRAAKVTKLNLSLCYPDMVEAERKQLAYRSVIETGVTGAELMWVWCQKPETVFKKIVKIEGEALYQQAVSAEDGVFICAPHLGNWEVVGLYCATQHAITSMYAPIKNAGLDALVKQSREATKANLVPTDTRGVRALLKALKQGHQVGILPDQRAQQGSGIFSPFFGVSAYTMTLFNALQQKSGGIVLMSVAERVKGGWVLHFVDPDEDIYHEDQQQSVDALNRSVENVVALCPEQYQWEYKRFAKQPDGNNVYNALGKHH